MARGTGKSKRKRCGYCRGYFHPNPSKPNQKFCREDCQKNFWKHGGAATLKLVERFERAVDGKIQELRDWVEDNYPMNATLDGRIAGLHVLFEAEVKALWIFADIVSNRLGITRSEPSASAGRTSPTSSSSPEAPASSRKPTAPDRH